MYIVLVPAERPVELHDWLLHVKKIPHLHEQIEVYQTDMIQTPAAQFL